MPLHTSNIVMQKTDTTPAGANQTEGSLYYDDSEAILKQYDGSAWGAVKAPDVNEGGTMRTYQHAGTGTVYQVHIFDNPGTYLWKLVATKSCDIFMVGGGGAGGNGLGGGGGGGVVAWCTGKSIAAGTYSLHVAQGGRLSTYANQGGHYGEASWIQLPIAAGGQAMALGGGGGGGESGNFPMDIAPIGASWGGNNWVGQAHGNSGGGGPSHSSFRYHNTHNPVPSGWTVRANGEGGQSGGTGNNYPSGGGGSGAADAPNVSNSSSAGGAGAGGVNSGAGVTWVTPRVFAEGGTHNGVAIDATYTWGGGGGGASHSHSGAAGIGGAGGGGGGANGNSSTGGAAGGGSARATGGTGYSGGNAAGGNAGANTGGGGGGGCDGSGAGGAGGSGIIVIRYAA